jgi:uncharacterized NAD(P)/FAD-binding protein YdhS
VADRERAPSHVAIVGCGFTGTTALHQLVHNYPVKRITVFEASGEFGPGFPYQTDESRQYLLNNSNDTMCLTPSSRRAFVEWLRGQPQYAIGLDEKASMPRAVYGEFLKDVIRQAKQFAERQGIDVVFIEKEVLDLEENKNGGVTLLTDNDRVTADVAILATGRCPDYDIYDLADAPADRYFPLHIPGTKLEGLPLDAECHVLGSSLSAYDVVNQLFAESTGCRFIADGKNRLRYEANGNQRSVVLCSRSGRLKKVKSKYPYPVSAKHFSLASLQRLEKQSVTVQQLFDRMQQDATEHGVTVDWQQVSDPYAGCDSSSQLQSRAIEILQRDIDAAASDADSKQNFIVDYLCAAEKACWDIFAAKMLSPEEEHLFRSKCESAILNYMASCPSLTAQKILALMQSGNLRILPGVSGVSVSDPFEIEHRFGTARADYLINASGVVDRNVSSDRQSPLIRNLQKKGLIRPYQRLADSSNGIDVNLQTFQSNASNNVLIANMFLWGPGIYVSSAILMATIVERLLTAAFGENESDPTSG